MEATRIPVALVGIQELWQSSLALSYLKLYALKHERIRNHYQIESRIYSNAISAGKIAADINASYAGGLVGFSTYSWSGKKICSILPHLIPGILIFMGGPDATHCYERWLKHERVRFILRGEAEISFTLFLEHYLEDPTLHFLKRIPGAAFRNKKGIFVNPAERIVRNLDDIPSPLLNNELEINDRMYLQMTRGCRMKCAYCSERSRHGLRSHSVERVLAEHAYLLTRTGLRQFTYVDSDFDPRSDLALSLAGLFQEKNSKNIRVVLLEARVDMLNEEDVKTLVRLNVSSVETGPQSINPVTLRNIARGFRREAFEKGVQLLCQYGIKPYLDLILGLPGDDFFLFLNSLYYCFSLSPHEVQVNPLCLIPGTPLVAKRKAFGIRAMAEQPYWVVSTKTFSAKEIGLAKLLAEVLNREYRLSRHLRYLWNYGWFSAGSDKIDPSEEARLSDIIKEHSKIFIEPAGQLSSETLARLIAKAIQMGCSTVGLCECGLDYSAGRLRGSSVEMIDFDPSMHQIIRRVDVFRFRTDGNGLSPELIERNMAVIAEERPDNCYRIELELSVDKQAFATGERLLRGLRLEKFQKGVLVCRLIFSADLFLNTGKAGTQLWRQNLETFIALCIRCQVWPLLVRFPVCLVPELLYYSYELLVPASKPTRQVSATSCIECVMRSVCPPSAQRETRLDGHRRCIARPTALQRKALLFHAQVQKLVNPEG